MTNNKDKKNILIQLGGQEDENTNRKRWRLSGTPTLLFCKKAGKAG